MHRCWLNLLMILSNVVVICYKNLRICKKIGSGSYPNQGYSDPTFCQTLPLSSNDFSLFGTKLMNVSKFSVLNFVILADTILFRGSLCPQCDSTLRTVVPE